MKKRAIFYSTLTIMLSMHFSILPMQFLSKIAHISNNFGLANVIYGTIGLGTSLNAIYSYKHDKNVLQGMSALPQDNLVKKFVNDVAINELGHNEQFIKNLHVISDNNNLARGGINHLLLPIDEDRLTLARLFKNNQTQLLNQNHLNAHNEDIKREADRLDVSVADFSRYKSFWGKTANSETFDFYKAVIGHEIEHVLQNHTLKRVIFPSVALCVAQLGELALNKYIFNGSLTNYRFTGLLAKLACVSIGKKLYLRYQENQADNGLINRTKDPKILRALANGLEAFDKVQQANFSTKYPSLKIFASPYSSLYDLTHPSLYGRAKKLNTAADKLEAQNRT